MTEKSSRKVSRKTRTHHPNNKHIAPIEIKRGRGRPKGAKNKPKAPQVEVKPVAKEKRKYTRKQKPELPLPVKKPRGRPSKQPIAAPEQKAQKVIAVVNLDDHPVLAVVKWLEKHMHHNEMQYYRSRATKNGVSLHVAMASDILGFFNVQDPEICNQIKKNNFIANTPKCNS
jgi:hypothetical protein